MGRKDYLLRSNGTSSGEQPQSRPRPIPAASHTTSSTPYGHSYRPSSAMSTVSSLSSYSSNAHWNSDRASQATAPSPISPLSPTFPLHPAPFRPRTPLSSCPGTPIPFPTPSPAPTTALASLDSEHLYSTLSTSTLHPPTSPTQTSLWLSYLNATHDRARLHLALTAFPDISATIAHIRHARDTAVPTPLPAYVPKYFPREYSHLRNRLYQHPVQRPAKGIQGDKFMHTLTQRAKRIPKYRNILDEEMYVGALRSAQSEWIYSKNTYRKLYPPVTYESTFADESDVRRMRQGRWLAKCFGDYYEGKAARCPEFVAKRRITLEGKAYKIPFPKEKPIREVIKSRKPHKPNKVKEAVKQKIAAVRRGSVESTWSTFSAEVDEGHRHMQEPAAEEGYETKQGKRLRNRAKSIFHKPSKSESVVPEMPIMTEKDRLRSRAKSIFGGQPATSAPASAPSNGLRSRARTLISKSKAKTAHDEVPLLPSAMPVAVAEQHAIPGPFGVPGNPWSGEVGAQENDPCSLNYRSTRRYYL